MHTRNGWGVIVATLALGACGGGGSEHIDGPGGRSDGQIGTADAAAPDAAPGAPDADLSSPDAQPGAFVCNGQPNPTTAPATISISGSTDEISATGYSPVSGATVDLFLAGGITPVGTTMSTGIDATWAFNDIATSGIALDGFLRATFPAGNRKTVFVYPPRPIFEDNANVVVATVSQDLIDLVINPALADPDQDPALGGIGVLVTDCLGNPLAGAVVTTSPAGTQVLYRNAAGEPDPTATSTGPDGIGIVFNVAPGNVVVDALYQSYDMRQHTIVVKKIGDPDNALATTIVLP